MGLERAHEILDELVKNTHQSAGTIEASICKNKNRCRSRGTNSEVFAKFLISRIPEVTAVKKVHEIIDSLDCDLQVEFINTDPVNVQVKSSQQATLKFMEKMKEARSRTKKPLRWVLINLELPFEQIQKDFVAQVNKLDGIVTVSVPSGGRY